MQNHALQAHEEMTEILLSCEFLEEYEKLQKQADIHKRANIHFSGIQDNVSTRQQVPYDERSAVNFPIVFLKYYPGG